MFSFLNDYPLLSFGVIYLATISFVSVIMCIYDKKVSKKGRVELRASEKSLLALALFGGSVAMFITMLLIRHKTKHLNFMLGIPLIMVLQGMALFLLFKYGILVP